MKKIRQITLLMTGLLLIVATACAGIWVSCSRDYQKWIVSAQKEAQTNILDAEYTMDTTTTPDSFSIDVDALRPEEYDEAKTQIHNWVKTIKERAERALDEFDAWVREYRFADRNMVYAAQCQATNPPLQSIEDFRLYLPRKKTAAKNAININALCQRTAEGMSIAQVRHWKALDEYVDSAFLAQELIADVEERQAAYEAEQQLIREAQWAGVPAGAAGRLRIPQYNISIPLYVSRSQSVVDAKNSAAMFPYNGVTIIGDHWNQNGFSAVRNMPVGTRVYIDNPDGSTTKYVVSWSGIGHNTGHGLLFPDNSLVDARYGNLALYTCLDNWQNIAIVCCC